MITDTEARKIASEWHGGGGSALYAFSSTGAIDTAREDHSIMDEIGENIRDQSNVVAMARKSGDIVTRRQGWRNICELVELQRYIITQDDCQTCHGTGDVGGNDTPFERCDDCKGSGTRGPVEGWSKLTW